jgi:hypothetical protein
LGQPLRYDLRESESEPAADRGVRHMKHVAVAPHEISGATDVGSRPHGGIPAPGAEQ